MQLTMVSVTLNVFPNLDCNFGLALLMFNKTLDAKKISVQNTFHLSVTLTAKYVSFGQDHGGSEAKLWCAKAKEIAFYPVCNTVLAKNSHLCSCHICSLSFYLFHGMCVHEIIWCF
ncbi:unnamed protein product [Clavelina lepadiformis]|uniref:Uncharacterized protein n=1 Tax=Clavelina lepadiformis TaxID=159417 RepID=A0ABP0FIC3_CLALP